jgi:hypothetical protein
MWCEGQTVEDYCEDKLEPNGSEGLKVLNYLAVKLELN